MTQKLAGKRCLITGGSRGLGRQICLAFARAGARVAFTYSRNESDAEKTRAELQELGLTPLVYKGSVSDSSHVSSTIKDVCANWDGLDILVNNAGFTQVLPIGLLEEEDWDAVMDVHAKGTYLFSRAALKPMIRARSGSILNIGSFTSERVVETPVHYAAAKSALRGLTEALAREVGRYGIKVNLLAPGLLDSGLSQILPKHRIDDFLRQNPSRRLGTTIELAQIATFLVSDENSFMSGAKIVADGGL
jgi:3-oxoacyl-[acyl-carrier protein] reductase